MKVWCDTVTAGAKAKVAGTFDDIGTITVKQNASTIIGFLCCVATPKPTSGISGMPILQINSPDLGISNQKVGLGNAVIGDGIATNDKEFYTMTQFVPWKNPLGNPLGNAKITPSLSVNTAITEGFDAAIGLIVSDSEPDIPYAMELLAMQHGRVIGGDTAVSSAGVSAASETALSNVIAVNSNASELAGLLSLANSNAPTADEGITGYCNFTAPQIDDFSPQKWPFILSQHGSLGTPVGTPSGGVRAPYYPTRFPLPRVNFDMSLAVKFSVAMTAAADFTGGAVWR